MLQLLRFNQYIKIQISELISHQNNGVKSIDVTNVININATVTGSNFEIYKFDSAHYDGREVA